MNDTNPTYPVPKDGWICFHCGERFTTPGSAADHFGGTPDATAACRIKFGDEMGLVMELRKAETSRDEWMAQCLATRSENEGLESRVASLTTEMRSYAPFRECNSISDVFCLYDSLEGELIALRDRLTSELTIVERYAWQSLARFRFWHFGYWASVWSIINRLGNLGRNVPWRDITADATMHASQLPTPETHDNGKDSIQPR